MPPSPGCCQMSRPVSCVTVTLPTVACEAAGSAVVGVIDAALGAKIVVPVAAKHVPLHLGCGQFFGPACGVPFVLLLARLVASSAHVVLLQQGLWERPGTCPRICGPACLVAADGCTSAMAFTCEDLGCPCPCQALFLDLARAEWRATPAWPNYSITVLFCVP